MHRVYAIFISMLMLVSFNNNNYGISIEKGTLELNEVLSDYEESNEHIPIIIVLEEQYNTNQLYNEVKDLPKKERRERTVSVLKEFSKNNQSSLRRYLIEGETNGLLTDPHFFWICNAVSVKASMQTLKELNQRQDIKSLLYDHKEIKEQGSDTTETPLRFNDEVRTESEVGQIITTTGADKLWEQGYFGQGVVVALLDDGVNLENNDIRNQLWTHSDYPHAGYNFFDDNNYPGVMQSDGTMLSGIIAGDGTNGIKTGLAPKSSLMVLKVRGGYRLYPSDLVEGIEFAIEHDADMLILRGDPGESMDYLREFYRNTMENVLSTGLLAVVSTNRTSSSVNPPPTNINSPADCPPPWLHPDQVEKGGLSAVLTVGATYFDDSYYAMSGEGPVTWEDIGEFNDYPYDSEMGLIKPDIVAPGVKVTSIDNSSSNYSEYSNQGLAGAAVAGAIALLLSKDPSLTPEKITQILEENARKLSDTKSNKFGSGSLDVYKASETLTDNRSPGAPFNVAPHDEKSNTVIDPVLRWEKNRQTTSYNLYFGTDSPPTNIVNGMELTDSHYKHTEALQPSTTYYWKIVAHNSFGASESEVWSFETEASSTIDFDSGEFPNYDWDFITTGEDSEEWYITDDSVFAGSYSARSGKVKSVGSTRLILNLDLKEDGDIVFYFKTSSEQKFDFLRFYIGSSAIAEWSGENEWQRASFPITKGKHLVSWIYVKNTPGIHGDDAAWIDNITFPAHYNHGVAHPPYDITTLLGYDSIDLSWSVETNEGINLDEFDFQGFNVYWSVEGSDFKKVNSNPISETQYKFHYIDANDYYLYVTAVYNIKGKAVEAKSLNTYKVTILPAIADPEIYPPSGLYNEPIEASIEVEEDTIVFYTIDGTTPDYTAAIYEEPFSLSRPTVLKAIAYKLGSLPSEMVVRQYIVNTSDIDEIYALPKEFTISLYPNPVRANSTTRSREALTIELAVPEPLSNIDIDIYNIKGQHIRNFQLSNVSRGMQHVEWDLKTHQDRTATNGIYLLKIKTDDKHYHRRVMLLR
ncbi:MAG: S8 family serine peptidase [Candidatus Cloacimonas sp.]